MQGAYTAKRDSRYLPPVTCRVSGMRPGASRYLPCECRACHFLTSTGNFPYPELELELIQPHLAQKPVLRGEVGCACVAR